MLHVHAKLILRTIAKTRQLIAQLSQISQPKSKRFRQIPVLTLKRLYPQIQSTLKAPAIAEPTCIHLTLYSPSSESTGKV